MIQASKIQRLRFWHSSGVNKQPRGRNVFPAFFRKDGTIEPVIEGLDWSKWLICIYPKACGKTAVARNKWNNWKKHQNMKTLQNSHLWWGNHLVTNQFLSIASCDLSIGAIFNISAQRHLHILRGVPIGLHPLARGHTSVATVWANLRETSTQKRCADPKWQSLVILPSRSKLWLGSKERGR